MSLQTLHDYSQWIKALAIKEGFSYCGISKAEFLEKEARSLENWLKRNYHGEMAYMENYFDKRLDPRLLVEGAQSVISLMLNYYPEEKQNHNAPKISMYAYGDDYHDVIKKKCANIIAAMQEKFGDIHVRCFVDSAPVMDKAWAQKSGLGWIGKNTNLIHKGAGSYFFLAEIITDIKFDYDLPDADFCGNCTRCMDACPTQAIVEPYIVDGSKCISYLTIELKNEIPTSFKNKMDGWIFGCDICQLVCPWNRFSVPNTTEEFKPSKEILNMTTCDWNEITEEIFKEIFKRSAVKRTKYKGLHRNISFIKTAQ